jgi:hypothetical protein
VWVGGGEVTDHLLDETTAVSVAALYRALGFEDVVIEEIPEESNPANYTN